MEKDTFGFRQEEDKPIENVREKNQAIGAGVLGTIKAPEEIVSTFDSAKKNGAIPEGVRDEQDYREYLAEQEARNKEFEKFDNEIFEGIMSIENPDDRDLATAILPYYYNDELDNRDTRGRKDIARRAGMKAVVNYMNGDKAKSLNDAILDIADKFYHDSRYEWIENSRAAGAASEVIENDHLADLIKGQELGQLDTSEAEIEEYGYEFTFTDPDGNKRSHLFPNNIFFETKKEEDEARITLNLANDITKRIKEAENYDDTLEDRINLSTLARVYKSGDNDEIKREKNSRLFDVLRSAEIMMKSNNFDASESALPFSNTGLLGLICTDHLENQLNDYQFMYARYKQSLKVGRAILNGEKDWHEVDVAKNITRESRKEVAKN